MQAHRPLRICLSRAMCADLFGSHSSLTTSLADSTGDLVKSTLRYTFLCPPPLKVNEIRVSQ